MEASRSGSTAVDGATAAGRRADADAPREPAHLAASSGTLVGRVIRLTGAGARRHREPVHAVRPRRATAPRGSRVSGSAAHTGRPRTGTCGNPPDAGEPAPGRPRRLTRS